MNTNRSRICKVVAMALLLTFAVMGDSIAQSRQEVSKADPVRTLESKLNELLVQYTEYHPEVIRLRQQIQLLQEKPRTAALDQTQQPSVATKNTNGSTETIPSQEKAAPATARIVPLPTSSGDTPGSAITSNSGEGKTSTPQLSLTSSPPAPGDTLEPDPVAVTTLPATASTTPVVSAMRNPATEMVSNSSGVTSEVVKPTRESKKGPTFTPLPPDLAPGNETQKNKSAAAIKPDANKSMETLDDKHRLAIGDRLSFRILEDEEDSKALVVADSGEVELPNSLGRFVAEKKSCKELARIIKAELEKEYYYHATVMIYVDLMARSRGKVYLAGCVRAPGPQEIPSDEQLTLSKAVLRASGFTDFANQNKVKVISKGDGVGRAEQEFIVNVAEILEKGRTEFDLVLQPDDLVYVPERMIRF
jgi:polysaccharide export outer membrane protein